MSNAELEEIERTHAWEERHGIHNTVRGHLLAEVKQLREAARNLRIVHLEEHGVSHDCAFCKVVEGRET